MKKALTALIATAAVAGGLATASPASAATNPYTPAGVCGSGYVVRDSHPMTASTIYLLYNGSSNCVVTIKTSSIGTATRTGAYLQASGAAPIENTDSFSYYAGPVKASAAGKCVIWGRGCAVSAGAVMHFHVQATDRYASVVPSSDGRTV